MNPISVSVLVPAFNEESLVGESLRRLLVLAECRKLVRIQVIVVNDGSRDHTADAVRKFLGDAATLAHPGPFEWLLLHHETNRGKAGRKMPRPGHSPFDLSAKQPDLRLLCPSPRLFAVSGKNQARVHRDPKNQSFEPSSPCAESPAE